MNNIDVKLTTFDTKPANVIMAQYKNSNYFFISGSCINESLNEVQGNLDTPDLKTLQRAVNFHIKNNPDDDVAEIQLYNFVLLDDSTTTVQFVEGFCRDVMGIKRSRAREVVNELNSEAGESIIGAYTFEVANTIARLLDNGNYQFECNLGHRIDICTPERKFHLSGYYALQELIMRDYPLDSVF